MSSFLRSKKSECRQPDPEGDTPKEKSKWQE